MQNPPVSLLARARAYTKNRAGRTALTVAPLAMLGLTAESARAVSVAGPTFNPMGTVTYPGDTSMADAFGSGTGNIAGSALPTGANGLTGAKYQGNAAFTEFESGRTGTISTITEFSLTGTGSGTLTAADGSVPIFYDFTLGTTAATNDVVSITGWNLNLSITSSSGTGTQTVTNTTGGAGTFSGSTMVTVPGAAAGATLTGYTGSLVVNYSIAGNGNGAMLSVTVPVNSIDFNAVPEPSSWVILSAGALGAGLYVMRVRSQRPQNAPVA